jgi:mannitol-specific phosphotransferase system IIBC component
MMTHSLIFIIYLISFTVRQPLWLCRQNKNKKQKQKQKNKNKNKKQKQKQQQRSNKRRN